MNKEEKYQKIEELQKEAKLLGLDTLIESICYSPNDKCGYYNRNNLVLHYIPEHDNYPICAKYFIKIEGNRTVFEAYRTTDKNKELFIEGFIPGDWIKEVQKLGEEALQHKKEAEEKEKKNIEEFRRKEEERKFKKFGL